MELTAITDAELAAFYTQQGLAAITPAESKRLQALSFVFLCALPWCENAVIDQAKFNLAQGYLIHAMSTAGGGFNPLTQNSGAQLKRRGLGRNALEREWFAKPDELNGTSPIYQLRTLPIPYGLLVQWLCPELEDAKTTEADNCTAVMVF